MADNLLSRLTGTPVVLPIVTTPQAYTPASSQGLGTLGASQLEWRQVGNKSHIMGKQEVGTVTASEARLALPSGQTIGTFAGTSGRFIVGKWAANNGAGITKNGVVMATTGQTYLTFGTDMDTAGTTSPLTQRNGNDLFSNSVVISFEEELAIPISGWSTHQAYGAGQATATTPGLVSAQDSGTFAVTLTGGFTANPTGTMSYTRVGNVVTLKSATGLTGVSNATTNPTAAAATLPLSIRPAAGRLVTAATLNNSVNGIGSVVIGSDGSMAFYATPASLAASFAAANNKGVSTLFDAVYTL